MPRRALLLAIADYDPLPALNYVANDIARLKAALTRAGFDPKHIEAVGGGSGEMRARELTTARLRAAIVDFLDSADPDDEMLVFFSGHGIELDGRRVLLPQDFTPKHPGSADDVVTDSWISGYARGCKARSVIVLIDACREGARYALAPSKSARFEKDAPLRNEYIGDATTGPTIAFLYSCDAGEYSGRDRQGEDCSAFTRAFAEAIELEKGPAEFEAIAAEARRRLAAFSSGTQMLVASGRAGRGGGWACLVIKEDEAARFRSRLDRSEWSRRLSETELFGKLKVSLPAFATQLQALAMRAEEQVAESRRVLPIQRWRDETAWCRQAARIYHVFLSAAEAEDVPAAEKAVLLAVPFVYEAALAAAEARLAAAGAVPDPETAAPSSGFLVNAWRNAWRECDAAQIRRALIARHKQDAADDHSCWSVVDFCHTSGELWDAQGGAQDRTGWAFDAVTALVAPAPLAEVAADPRVCEILSAPRLLRLARLMFAGFDDLTLDAVGGNRFLDPQVSCGEFTEQLTISEVRLAHLLNLGSQLTLDPRRMPSVLAEHVGTDDVLSADWLRLQLAGAEWHTRTIGGVAGGQGERWFDLRLDCANDAMDAALLAVVDALESYRTRLLQRQDVHAAAMRDLLPAGFTVNRLNATPSGWHPTRPPLRFELDRTRIIDLLMGQQLYGERWPALRELYQNALDACRYRRAAEQLAVHEGHARSGNVYEGRIAIRFGADSGRRFVECVDDGIGMADRHIRRLFACAGQRFADSHEFHIDRARWDVADIKFFPNSRFGVGVLSYFMLAEELDIASHRWMPPTDLAPAPVHARIIGSGSLFRLDPVIDPTRLADYYGTSVRLYLREDAPDSDVLLKSILNWLFVPEMTVTIYPEVGETAELAARQPTNLFRALTRAVLLPVAGSEDTKGAPRVYIAPSLDRHRGPLSDDGSSEWGNRNFALVDGIATGLMNQVWPKSIVVNLTEDLRTTLTVDRRHADPAEATVTAVVGWIGRNGGAALAAWTAPDFTELHRTIAELHPSVTVSADATLRAIASPDATLTLPMLDASWPLFGAGISDLDPEIVCELFRVSGLDVLGAYAVPLEPAVRTVIEELSRLAIRRSSSSSLNPVVTQGIFCRAIELAEAGLRLPNWLGHAVSYETRNRPPQAFPATCRPVLAALNALGCVGLREVLRWTDDGLAPVLDAMRAITESSPEMLGFDINRLDKLEPLHRKLCRLSSGNRLGWVELAYFLQSEGLPLGEVRKLAEDLSGYGVLIPDLDSPPKDINLTELEAKLLSDYFKHTDNSARISREYFHPPFIARAHVLSNLVRRLGDSLERGEEENDYEEETQVPRPSGLTRMQKILLSEDLDDSPPFLSQITTLHLFKASRDRQFGTLAEAVRVARSLGGTRVDLGRVLSFDDGLIAQFDKALMTDSSALTDSSARIVSRLFHALDHCRPASVWDLALAADAAKIEPRALRPVLDLLEGCGGHVARCREFLAFCAEA
jgi:Caspase domain